MSGNIPSSIDHVLEPGRSYYDNLNHEARDLANNIFNWMDGNGDGEISVSEVINFIASNGLPTSDMHRLFECMGLSDGHILTVRDVVAVWYTFFNSNTITREQGIIRGNQSPTQTSSSNLNPPPDDIPGVRRRLKKILKKMLKVARALGVAIVADVSADAICSQM